MTDTVMRKGLVENPGSIQRTKTGGWGDLNWQRMALPQRTVQSFFRMSLTHQENAILYSALSISSKKDAHSVCVYIYILTQAHKISVRYLERSSCMENKLVLYNAKLIKYYIRVLNFLKVISISYG